jgi:hypothetical protein
VIKSCDNCYWYDQWGCRASFSLQQWKDDNMKVTVGLCPMWSTHYSDCNLYYRKYKKELKYEG